MQLPQPRVVPCAPAAAGTNMATRLFAAVESQLDLDLDSNEPASGEESGECPSSVVDFDLLPPTALMRYVQHYKIAVPPEADIAWLVRAVEEHFCGTVVDEVALLPIPLGPAPAA